MSTSVSVDESGRPRSSSAVSGGNRSRTSSFNAGRVVILAIDASENARNAFDYYLGSIYKPDDSVVLVHCPEPPRLPTFSFKSGIAPPVEEWKKVLDEVNERTRKLEEDYEGTCIGKKIRYKVREETSKSPGEGICRIAEEEDAELIILGSRGLNAVKRALLGSVSEYVCRHAGIPTLIVPFGKRSRTKSRTTSGSEAN